MSSNDMWHPLAPRVHSAEKRRRADDQDHQYHLVSEFITAGLPDLSGRTARQLAAKMLLISRLPRDEVPWLCHSAYDLSPAFLDGFIATVEMTGRGRKEADNLQRDWNLISSVHSLGLTLVPCHNDLNANNIGYRPAGAVNEILFFDWIQFDLNYLGSDVHHLLRSGLLKPQFSRFFDRMYGVYRVEAGKTHGVPPVEVDVAALSYALYRCMWRAVRTNGEVMQLSELAAIHQRLMAAHANR